MDSKDLDSNDLKYLKSLTRLELMAICREAIACVYCGSSDGKKRSTTIMNAEGNEEQVFVCSEGPCSQQPITRFH
jgi:hypothetical protein